MNSDALRGWLGGRARVLDGATGSELIRRGVAGAERGWGVGALLASPAAVADLHRDYLAAGAEAATAATFRVAPYTLRRLGLGDDAARLASRAIRLARNADPARQALVLAAQTTLEDCYRPDLVPADAVLDREHRATAAILAAAGPDALLLETFNTVREARIATAAAAATGLAVVVSFAASGAVTAGGAGGVLLSGEELATAAAAVTAAGAAAVGVNCTAVRLVPSALAALAEGTDLPLVAYANDGWHADDSPWLAALPLGPDAYALEAAGWTTMGARLVGGCCGTGPAHVAALRRRLATPG
jgi:S-methylmethionine-dependent homocysteine/selenocysteine methylase